MAVKATTPTAGKHKALIPETPISQAMQASMRSFMIGMIAGTTLIVLIGGYFVWLLANQNILITNKIKAQGIYIDLAKDKVKTLDAADTKLTELKKPQANGLSDYELVTVRALPDSDDLGILLTIFQKLESNTLVKIENISKPSATAAAATKKTTGTTGAAKSFALSFKSTGSYDQIQKFLKSLENSTRVFDFSTLKIDGANGQISLTMTYSMYYLPKPSIDDQKVPINDYKKGPAK